jgi:hypothetical protein
MSGAANRVGIRKGKVPGEVFPTADHPPGNILMRGGSEGSPGMVCDG